MWYEDQDYGSVELRRDADGTLTVERADPVIGVALSLLKAQPGSMQLLPDLTLVIAGTLRYRVERVTTDDIVVCRRING